MDSDRARKPGMGRRAPPHTPRAASLWINATGQVYTIVQSVRLIFTIAGHMRFNEQKVTEAAAFLLELRGGCMHYIKLLKLLYIADRQALSEWGIPISDDNYVAMDNGPVLSQTYNLIKDGGRFWSEHISAPFGDYEIELSKPLAIKKLSPAEEEILRAIFAEYGHQNRWKIVDFMHTLPEWKDPGGSSIPIATSDILRALNEPEENIRAIVAESLITIPRECRAAN